MTREEMVTDIESIIFHGKGQTYRSIAKDIVDFIESRVLKEHKKEMVYATLDALGQAIKNQGY